VQAGDAVRRIVDGEAALFEEIDDRASDVTVVLDQQDVRLARLSPLVRHGDCLPVPQCGAVAVHFAA
jgi:hypothetical protein